MTDRTIQPTRCRAAAPTSVRRAAEQQLAAYRTANPDRPDLPRDWQCVRDDTTGPHLAMPLGIAGPSIRFDAEQPATRADLDELLARPGVAVVRVEHGDELLMLMPHDDTDTAERAATTLAELYPAVSFMVLAGITGAVVMPRREGCTPACSEGHTYAPGCEQYIGAPAGTAPDGPEKGDAAADQPCRAQQLVDELRADDDYDGRLIDGLADLGRRWGPWGVARAAAFLTGTTLARDADAREATEPTPEPVDEYHTAGVYCGESAHCTPPYPGALPGTPYDDQAPAYVHALADAWLTGQPLNFQREHVPADLRRRLDAALADGTLAGELVEVGAGLWRNTVRPAPADVQPGPAKPTEAICKCPTGPCGHDRERVLADQSRRAAADVTVDHLRPGLAAAGVADPERFVAAYDDGALPR
ncbi:hypothetical protein [Micromonospora sp. NPDC049645]|uniref:hypothetical protein n=1 Tax=Micromonospora sp. NPDC049645 TaxID=3155508 RepID=UPI003429237F